MKKVEINLSFHKKLQALEDSIIKVGLISLLDIKIS